MTTVTLYRLTASMARDGHVIDCTSAEVIGAEYGRYYGDRWEAESAKIDLEADLDETDLDPSTTYGIEEIIVSIDRVRIDDDIDGHGATAALARVRLLDRTIDTAICYCAPRHVGTTVDGWEPAGDHWLDEDLIDAVGLSAADAIGREIVASA